MKTRLCSIKGVRHIQMYIFSYPIWLQQQICFWLTGTLLYIYSEGKFPTHICTLKTDQIYSDWIYKEKTIDTLDFFKVVLFNQTLTSIVLGLVQHYWPNQSEFATVDIPRFVGILLIAELAFYSIHRFVLHSGPGYFNIHCIHHQFRTPNPFASVYAHPLEHLCQNLFPLWLGLYLTNSPIGLVNIFSLLTTINAEWTHTTDSYYKPHIVHHLKRNGNYGSELMDKLFGTDIKN